MKKFLSYFIFIICISQLSNAQVSTYSFYQTSEVYTSIAGGIVVGLNNEDGTIYDSIPIGFNFNFNSSNFNMLSLSTNGYVVLGPDTGTVAHYPGSQVLSSGNTMNNLIAAFNDNLAIGSFLTGDAIAGTNFISSLSSTSGLAVGDIVDINGNFAPSGTIITAISNDTIFISNPSFSTFNQDLIQFGNGEMRVQTIGTAPNRICVIQWKNAHKSSDVNDCYNFQIRLHETSQRVQTIYNIIENNINPYEVQVGLTGNTRADFNIRTTATNWSNTTAGATNFQSCSTSNTIIPPLGLSFNWELCVPSTQPIVASSLNSFCSGNSTILTIVSGNLNGAANWSWFSDSCNGAFVGTGTSIIVAPASTTVYYARGTGGCVGSNMPCDSIAIIVLPNPVVSISIAPNSTVICNGSSVTLNGVGAATYVWNNNVLNNVPFIAASSNLYSVIGTSIDGCTASASQFITLDTSTVNLVVLPNSGIACVGQNISLNATNLNNTSWSNGVANNVPFLASTSSTYTVTGLSLLGCTLTATSVIVVNANPVLNVISLPNNNNVCLGSTLLLNATGAPNIVWSPTIGNNTAFSPTISNIYTVVGTDLNSCTSSSTVSVTVQSISIVITPIPASSSVCAGGIVKLTASGATSYSWSGGVTNGVNFIANVTQVYTVTATSGTCSKTSTTLVTALAAPNVFIQTTPANATVCSGNSLTLNGIGAISYVWNPIVTNNIPFNPIISGVYTVVGTNAAGCTKSATKAIIVTSAPTLSINTTPSVTNICIGNSIVMNATTTGTTVTWSPTYTNNTVLSPTSSNVYTVTASSGANCSATSIVNVVVNSLPNVTVVSNPPNNQVCDGQPITLNGNGAVTYSYTGNIQNNVPIIPSGSGTFTITGSDAIGCSSTTVFSINVNLPANISVQSLPANAEVCQGALLTLTASGGISYLWTNNVNNGIPFTPSSIGTYTVIGTDANGCQKTATVFVMINASPTVNITSSPNNAIICNGDSITLNAIGTPNISWSNGIINNVPFTPLTNAIYTVTGTDGSSCSSSTTILVEVKSLPVTSISISPITGNICAGDFVTLTASGSGNIFWDNGIANSVPFQAIQSDVYQATIVDSNGCEGQANYSLFVNQPSPIIITSNPANAAVCNGSMFTLTASGNNTSYVWSPNLTNGLGATLTNSNVYTVVATNSAGCTSTATQLVSLANPLNLFIDVVPSTGTVCQGSSVVLTAIGASTYSWSPAIQNGVPFNAVSTNTYVVTATNATGCTATSSIVLNVLSLPTISIASSMPSSTICSNGPITLTASGANTYSWSPSITNGVSFNPTVSGVYTVTGVSTFGCSATLTQIVNILPLPNVTIASNPQNGNVCPGSSFVFVASGASSYTFSPTAPNGIYTILPATTTYTITGTASNGCTKSITKLMTLLSAPASPVITPVNDQTLCSNVQMSVSSIVQSGTTKNWSPFLAENTLFTPLVGTTLYVLISTAPNGCKSSDSINITGLPLPNVVVLKTPTADVCSGSTITLTPSGAISYTIMPNVASSFPFIFSQPAISTTYTITGTNTNGCTKSTSIVLNPGSVPGFNFTSSPSFVCLGSPITLSVSTTASGISFIYSPTPLGTTTFTPVNNIPFIASSANVTYTVTATNSVNGCTATKTILPIINSIPNLSITTTPINALNGSICLGSSATINATSATVGTTFSIIPSTVSNNVAFSPTSSQIYTVIATSTNSCSATSTLSINLNLLPTLTVTPTPNDSVCSGIPVTINVTSNGNVSISGGVIKGIPFSPTVSTIYTITTSNASGCQTTTTILITVLPKPVLTSSSVPSTGIVCSGKLVTLNATSNATNLSWSGGISNNVAFVGVNSTIYTATAIGTNGCSATVVRNVTVFANPTLVSSISPNDSVCAGAPVTIGLTSNGTIGIAGNFFTNGIPFTPTISKTYTVTASNAQGCTNLTTIPIVVLTKPTINYSSPTNANLCIGQTYTFTVVATSGSTISWSNGIANNAVVIANVSTPSSYTVTATAANGCTNSTFKSYNVIQPPIFNHTYAANDSLCSGLPFTLTASSGTSGITIANLIVSGSGLTIVNPLTRSGVANTTSATFQTFNYTMIATFSNGCAVQKIAPLLVLASPALPTIASSTNTVCPDGIITLTASSVSTFPLSFSLQSPTGISITNGVGFNNGPNAATYTVTATNTNNGCTRTNIKLVSVHANTLTITPQSQTVVSGSTATITASGGSAYVWTGGISNGVGFTPIASNIYTVSALSTNNCNVTSTAEVILVVPKLIQPLLTFDEMDIAPNPTSNNTQLIIESSKAYPAIIKITNLYGAMLRVINTEVYLGKNNIELDLSALPSGNYFVQIGNGKNILNTKMITKQ
jgi:Secretion system C-terminal sorting domain/Ig-like domain CHU_C associated